MNRPLSAIGIVVTLFFGAASFAKDDSSLARRDGLAFESDVTSGDFADRAEPLLAKKKKRKIRRRKRRGSKSTTAKEKAAKEKAAKEKAAKEKAAKEKAPDEKPEKANPDANAGKSSEKPVAHSPTEPAGQNVAPDGEPTDKTGGGKFRDPDELLKKAFLLYDDLEYDLVIPIAAEVLTNPNADVQNQLDAYLLQGSCLAIVGDPIEAEKPFRFLLRGRPDYDMLADTPPKILAVFRKVQVEERAILETTRELERQRVIASLKIDAKVVEEATGGIPLVFDFGLLDPRGAVGQVRVLYRRSGEKDYASLPMQIAPGGRWVGEIPGSWSENDDGFSLEYYITTFDRGGLLLITDGLADSPHRVPVAPGSVADAVPFYQTVWFWGMVGGTAAVVVGSAGAVGVVLSLPPASELGTVPLE